MFTEVPNLKHSKLTALIFIALILGVIVGHFAPDFAVKMRPFATIFLRMVKMIIAPLLFATLVVGISGHDDAKSLGKIGLKTIIYFEIVTTLALIIGLTMANLFKPGVGFVNGSSPHAIHMQEVGLMAATQAHTSISQMVTDIFPTSIVDAMAQGNLLQIVVFSIFFALAICAVGKKAQPVLDVLNSVSQIMFKFTEYVMYFAPLGIFGAIAATVGANGLNVLKSYFKVIGALYAALAVFVLLVLIIACKIVKISFRNLLRALQEPALLAFTTASSEAAFPKAMEIMERFGVPKKIVGFVMPTGYTFNLDGSTLYLAMGVIFSSQIVGINLDLNQQIIIMLALMLTSKGVAGVPRVSLIVLAGTLASFNIPILGVAILLGIDQILDMGRTTVNLVGNCVATVVIARWEKEFDYNKMKEFVRQSKEESIGADIEKFTQELSHKKSIKIKEG
ncbi:TPA: cation:dicarboxylase symporter family transporter [Candidatus Scatousia excrementigallinarum]|mgnify:FL=1|uniref:Cation:dicarboxylase symporter family transporter n=1 Tax=Candidatus Scatousia excrementigallinarum TaxID=2840935 RepID=A0A9D1EXX7_9BACT|nr:cation:dicarboxylase symporter family transporter [Candidatus Scatousia excrementigallinarum]